MESVQSVAASSPEMLAERLERDIQVRNLQAGERYLSTRQVRQRYHVPMASAVRAMEMLVAKRVLERRDRSGTFVGKRVSASADDVAMVRTIFILARDYGVTYTPLPIDQLILTLSRLRPNNVAVTVNFVMLREGEELAVVSRLIQQAEQSERLFGVLAITCGREVYRYLQLQGVPTVVFGSLDPDLSQLPSIDADYFEAGRLMASHLIDRGYASLGLLGVSHDNPGDHAFVDGVMQAVADAKLPANALMARLCHRDNRDLLLAHAQSLLSQQQGKPIGVICRSRAVVDVVLEAAGNAGLSVPEDVGVAYESFATAHAERMPYANVQTCVSFEEVATRVGQMMVDMAEGRVPSTPRVVIPVELRIPSASA